MSGVKGMDMGARSVLEPWQWEEAESDYRAGTSLRALAQRYGVKLATMRRHMVRAGVRQASWFEGV